MTADQTLITQNPFARPASEELVPTATIIFHPDTSRIGEVAFLTDLKQSLSTEISRLSPDFSNLDTQRSNCIADPYVSRKPITLKLLNGGIHFTKPSDLTGNVTVNGRLLVSELFIVGDEWQKGIVVSMSNRIVLYLHHSPAIAANPSHKHGLLGESNVIHKLRKAISRVADLHVPVLIRGETGTGKELIAQAIHSSSRRTEQSFISINIAAIPESLAISELFGSKKGAFTGATKDRAGYFQQAHNGTLFLDEIGDAHDQVQVALLRTLETGDVTPVGAASSINVDVRLITATDANLEKNIEENRFRSPLLQRLAGFEIHIAPLRKRREDIGRLLIHFLSRELQQVQESGHLESTPKNISFWAAFFTKACLYDWPGNVRQLINISQQLAIYNREVEQLSIPDHINELFSPAFNQAPPSNLSQADSNTSALDNQNNSDIAQAQTTSEKDSSPYEKPASPRRKPSSVTVEELHAALEKSRWDLKATSENLNISRAALYKMIDNTPSVRTAGDICLDELRSAYQNNNADLEKMVDELKVSKAALVRRLKDLQI
jgi:two-component system nitrogen regulation response regulator GlnG